jgi:hypothetical protein
VTCICSAALLRSLFTGTTCSAIVHHHQVSHSDSGRIGSLRTRDRKPKTERKQCVERHDHSGTHRWQVITNKHKQGGQIYLGWVTEGIFIHHICWCQNSGGWSQSVDTGLESTSGDCQGHSIWPKVYNLHRSFLKSIQVCSFFICRMYARKLFYLPLLLGSCSPSPAK